MTTFEFLRLKQENHILTVKIERESKLNAMNRKMVQELAECFQWAGQTEEVRVIILTGSGKAFMAGADIEGYSNFNADHFVSFMEAGREMYRTIEQCPKPVIAAVNGYALGGGFELALACDLIIASDRAKFGLPEVKLGLIPGGGGIQKLARIAGAFRAKQFLLTGQFMTGAEGIQLGFVNQVCPADELTGTVNELANQLAGQAPLAVRAMLRLVDEGAESALETAMAYDRVSLAQLYHTKDAQEGIRAFMEKRKPEFTGK